MTESVLKSRNIYFLITRNLLEKYSSIYSSTFRVTLLVILLAYQKIVLTRTRNCTRLGKIEFNCTCNCTRLLKPRVNRSAYDAITKTTKTM